jgi:hypothetical protein
MRIRRRVFTLVFLLPIAAASLCGQSEIAPLTPHLAPSIAPPITPLITATAGLSVAPGFVARPPRPAPPIVLPHMIHLSGAIFAGTVIAINRSPVSTKNAVATVAVTFHVDRGIRGAITGQDFTLHQWMGLWNSGQQRYRVGERVLLFLYPASKLGLSSWVSGSLGHFTFDGLGQILLSPAHVSAFRDDPILGGKSRISVEDFDLAVRRASAVEESGEGSEIRP